MKAPSLPESKIQKQIVDYLRSVAPHCLTFAIPNSARRTKNGFASNAVAGLTPGIPDLCLISPSGRPLFIEVKTNAGRLSKAQENIETWLVSNGIPHCVARSLDDVRTALKYWNIETRERAS